MQRPMALVLGMALAQAAVPWPTASAALVTIEGRRVLVDGRPFRMQGVCYQPTPVGQTATQPPFGDYFTANHRALYERDLPLMRALGANTLRVYNWDPAADHRHFLDSAWNAGVQPIYVLVNAYIEPGTDWANPTVVNQLKARWRTLASKVASHPAVIGFLIGNELNERGAALPAFWPALNDIAGVVRSVAANHLVTSPLSDVGLPGVIRTNETRMTEFNCWAAQLYRGRSFGALFTQYEAASSKPLLVTEFGMDAYDRRIKAEFTNNAALTAEYLRALWLEIERSTNTVCGGVIFEWADEWWKDQESGSSVTRHDQGSWPVPGFPDGTAEHEWWGLFRAPASNTATPEPRAAFAMFQVLWQAPRPRLEDPAIAPGQSFEATVEGPAGLIFRVQGSNDLVNWRDLATNKLPFRFRDTTSGAAVNRAYRAVEQR